MILKERLKYLYKKHFIFSSSILLISASFIGNVFGYLFQLLAGRNFSPSEYGVLVTLFAISGIIPLILIFITNGLPKLVAEIKDIDYPQRISSLFYTVNLFNIFIPLSVLILLIAFNKFIAEYLHIDDRSLLVPYSFAVAAGLLIYSIALFLQGLMRFKAYAIVKNGGVILKLLVLIIVLLLKLDIKNIFWGLTISTIFMGTFGIVLLKKNIKIRFFKINNKDLKTLIKYSLGGVLGLIAINSILHIDMILVKHYFDPVIAGNYSSLIIIGRILFYATSPVAIVMLPICSERYKKGKNYIKPFLSALLLTIIIGLSILLSYMVMPELIITTLLGQAYADIAYLLPLYGLYMLIYTILVMFTWFSISISQFRISSIAVIAPILQIILINKYHSDLKTIIIVSIFTTLISVIGLIFFNMRLLLKHRKKEQT